MCVAHIQETASTARNHRSLGSLQFKVLCPRCVVCHAQDMIWRSDRHRYYRLVMMKSQRRSCRVNSWTLTLGRIITFHSIDWFKGKITGNSHISWENLWFPVDFPLSQPIHSRFLEPASNFPQSMMKLILEFQFLLRLLKLACSAKICCNGQHPTDIFIQRQDGNCSPEMHKPRRCPAGKIGKCG